MFMKGFAIEYFPLIAVLAGLNLAFGFDRAALLRRRSEKYCGDRGDYWVFVIITFCWIMGALLLLSGWLKLYQPYWDKGYHLYFDIAIKLPSWLSPATSSNWLGLMNYVALAIPYGVWAGLMILGLIVIPGDRSSARWLAGAIGYKNSRLWVLYFTLPIIVILYATWRDLGWVQGDYPGAAWGALAVLLICVVAIAFSAGEPLTVTPKKETASAEELRQAPSLTPWPEAVAAHGIVLKPKIAVWSSNPQTRAVTGQYATALEQLLHRTNAREIAPELIEALASLLNPRSAVDALRLIYAPDFCGQVEVVALAAQILAQRYHTTTLVITVNKADELASQLRRWVPSSSANRVEALDQAYVGSSDALIWVVDAETLSDQFLPKISHHPKMIEQIGLVVWWHLEQFTGVLAANLWAISRRLNRLIHDMGRQDVRTLALVRRIRHSEAQIELFLNRLLPYAFPANTQVHAQQRFVHEVQLHVLERHTSQKHVDLILETANASVKEGWSTWLLRPDTVTDKTYEAFLQDSVSATSVLRDSLVEDFTSADVRLMSLPPSEVLYLSEIISHGGRASSTGQPHHVGLLLPDNPYAGYLLSQLKSRQQKEHGFGMSRRLVGAEPHREVIRRHLIMALNERGDTRSNLLKHFLLEEIVVDEILDEIFKEGQLNKSSVRYLNKEGRLVIEPAYKSQKPPGAGDKKQPLNTVSAANKLIEVRDPTKKGEIQMLVDPERLTIQAYPGRYFMYKHGCYVVRDWNKIDDVVKKGYLECQSVDLYKKTWRIMDEATVYGIKPLSSVVDVTQRAKPLSRVKVELKYVETISGVLRQEVDGIESEQFFPITQEFTTRALVLGFPQDYEEGDNLISLVSVCQALKQVLPVHMGVEDDALEVVPITHEEIESHEIFGIAIVDLYPNGIGWVDAIYDDSPFIFDLLEWTFKWLDNCSCKSNDGCNQCLRTLAASAATGNVSHQLPGRAMALKLLKRVIA